MDYQRKKYCIIGAGTLLILIVAISWCYIKKSVKQSNKEYNYVEIEAIESGLQDAKECWLCGNSNRSLMAYFRKFDDLGIICVNSWYVLSAKIRNYDEDGCITNAGGGSSFTGTGEEGCFFELSTMSDRGISKVTVNYGKENVLDCNKIKENLCQPCLDKVLESMACYKNKYGKVQPIDLCLVDFKTLEIYPLQDHNVSYFVRDYYVQIESQEDKKEILAVYAPKLHDIE